MNSKFIDIAINEAKKAYESNEVPIGAVIVKDNFVVSKAHNKTKKSGNITAHAEILAIHRASKKLGDWRLNDCVMYTTLEPCPMCAGAILQARIKKIYIGTTSNILSNKAVVLNILNNYDYYHNVEVEYLDNMECSNILTDFFTNKR